MEAAGVLAVITCAKERCIPTNTNNSSPVYSNQQTLLCSNLNIVSGFFDPRSKVAPFDKQKRTPKRRLLVQSEADIRHEITANNSSQPITHGVVEYRGTTAPTTRHRVSRQNAFLLSLLKYERDHPRCLCLHVCRISQQGCQQNAFRKAKKSISSRINLLSPPLPGLRELNLLPVFRFS